MGRRAMRVLGWAGLAALALLALTVAFFHTPPGRQLILDELGRFAPASGLRIEAGAIEGSVLYSATFRDVRMRDADGTLFLEVPELDLRWRPWRWFFSGLDVQHLVLSGGTLHALPNLLPGDPEAPILPDFDIRAERVLVQRLTVSEALLGEARVIDLAGTVDIRSGLAKAEIEGDFGGGEVLDLRLDAEPDADRFDLEADWRAPAGGVLATLAGLEQGSRLQVRGAGGWARWDGTLAATVGAERVLDATLGAREGLFSIEALARPAGLLEGLPARALGEEARIAAAFTLEESTLAGDFALEGAGLNLSGTGAIDLADKVLTDVALAGAVRDRALFGPDLLLDRARFTARLEGAFDDLTVEHELRAGRVDAGGTVLAGVAQQGTLSWDGETLRLPLDARIDRVTSGQAMLDPRLVDGTLGGVLFWRGERLTGRNVAVRFRGLDARLDLDANLASGRTRLQGPVSARGLAFEGIGRVDGSARIDLAVGGGAPWRLGAVVSGALDALPGSAVADFAGPVVRFAGSVSLGATRPVAVEGLRITSARLRATLAGQYRDGLTRLSGEGRHAQYGAFAITASMAADGPRATLLLADPLPAAGLRDVRLVLAPADGGFALAAQGGSLLGAFSGEALVSLPAGASPAIDIARLDVAETRLSGRLVLADAGVGGTLAVGRGGIDGQIALEPTPAGQGFAVNLVARNARFSGTTPIGIAQGRIEAQGVIGEDGASVTGTTSLQGLSYGNIFIGRLAARASLANGRGRVDAALAGRRGSRFDLQLNSTFEDDAVTLVAAGSYAGHPITMPRRAVLRREDDGGWVLQRTQLGYGEGFVVAEGRFGGNQPASGRLALSRLPLDLANAFAGDLGLFGNASGIVTIGAGPRGLPTGEARLLIDDLSRSSTLLASRPIDIALVARLGSDDLQARAVLSDEAGARGRLQARIAALPASGGLFERLQAGSLAAQMRYRGPAAALWRLAAVELVDITGEAALVANATGTLAAPRLTGALAGNALRVRSGLTGSDLADVRLRGRFVGSRLELTSMAGTAPNGGRVSGSGIVDLSGLSAARGPRIDLRLAAREAEILDLPTMGATVTGPLRLVSDGVGGTIAGRLEVQEARWRLGAAEELADALPNVAITEINLPADRAPVAAGTRPWRYLIDARAPGGIEVDGMGLDSEWRGDLRLRGTTEDPRIGGEVQVVPRQGFYSFAGLRFELTRGRIVFDESGPIDPRIDLVAEGSSNGLDVTVTVSGSASQTQVAFTSQPPLPQEELLARLLFGSSITQLSATDALQLGAALASLRGGSGLDPINRLRDAVGLDRLRLVPADPALGRGTAVALGKNLTRRFYLELITDGAGYSATELEFRVTGWLSLLATLSTVGRHSAAAEYRRDY